MRIKMKSSLTGHVHEMDLNITPGQWREWNSFNRRMVQDVFPDLSAEEREFLMTGITPDEWVNVFPPEEEEEDA